MEKNKMPEANKWFVPDAWSNEWYDPRDTVTLSTQQGDKEAVARLSLEERRRTVALDFALRLSGMHTFDQFMEYVARIERYLRYGGRVSAGGECTGEGR